MHQIKRKDKLSQQEQSTIWDGIEGFSQTQVPATGRYELAFLLRDSDGLLLGGVQGNYDNFGWLWIDSLWVSAALRGQGYGIRLLNEIESEARINGCKNSHLTSFSYQAVDFYKQQGYRVFGELEDYLPGHSRCWLRKNLV
ncbi:N-acetyltransferase [Shewanella sp. Choline-02u-19]|jgi:GNAT superfamily N-acetyltransferase|uniref:GNAT family N-acetyltransferase n=1 Tax=unclassified Shewanella TaxID=196818 RepID=UPI000C33866A|nr:MULTISPECIES: GNAT family N-acetyltransferase [unclassified Shewanella]PKG56271.1 N-acetyltransferase [Shewanella sp. GutDb-MelDb]PKG75859.1 N-acetyltransferase [Shewanella sp. GutCb]PKH59250.1 N-acetyltransferase [Shewanella sp. Bg11-22]PKI27125.1 N-acetyltransferase [Shewanella sp. Choline-02u-19]